MNGVISVKNVYVLSKKENLLYNLKYMALFFICLLVSVMMILYADEAKNSVYYALNICFQTVIPSLFPFLFLSAFIANTNILNRKFRLLDKISMKIFKLPSKCISVFILSLIGGFPVGAKTVKTMLENKSITENQAQRLLLFCVNPGPAFAVTAVGLSLLSNKNTGMIIYLSIALSNFIIAIFSRILDDGSVIENAENKNDINIAFSFVKSGNEAANSCLGICGYVLLFSCLVSMLHILIENEQTVDILSGLLEVTSGCEKLSTYGNIPLLAGIIAWGGISVHFQIMDCIHKTGLKLKMFLTARIISSALSIVLCHGLLTLFPEAVNVSLIKSDFNIAPAQGSFPVSAAMLMTCFLFLIGDYTIKYKIKRLQNVETDRKL